MVDEYGKKAELLLEKARDPKSGPPSSCVNASWIVIRMPANMYEYYISDEGGEKGRRWRKKKMQKSTR